MTDRGLSQDPLQPPAAGELRVTVLRSEAELAPLYDFWRSAAIHRDAQIDFFFHVLATYPEVRRPHVLAVHRGDEPLALLLGRFEEKAIGATIGYLRLPTPPLRLLNFPHGGRIGAASDSVDRALVASILASLRAGEADAALLHYLLLDAPLYRLAITLPPFWQRDHARTSLIHRRMQVPTAPGALLARLPAQERSNHRRRSRRLGRDFGDRLAVICFSAEAEIPRLAEAAELVARTAYQRGLGVGFYDTPALRERLALEARQGALRGFVLYLGDAPCAFWIVSLRGGVIYNDYLAYDPRYERYAPGMFLVVTALEQLGQTAQLGTRLQLDFGIGESAWKASWGDEAWLEGNVYIFGPSFRALTTSVVRSIASVVAGAARFTLARIGGGARVKRIWRRALARGRSGGP
jgi:hypothetical protein